MDLISPPLIPSHTAARKSSNLNGGKPPMLYGRTVTVTGRSASLIIFDFEKDRITGISCDFDENKNRSKT